MGVLTRALDKPSPPGTLATDALSETSSAGQIPEEGANHNYELFCRVSLGGEFNDRRYIAL